jgi:hypothetical protein
MSSGPHCLQAAASRQRCQFRNDRHALAFERGAAGKVAGQRYRERFSAGEEPRVAPYDP